MPNDLTPTQQTVLGFLKSFTKSQGYQPSQHEMAKFMSFASTSGVTRHLEALERKGYIKRSESGEARAIRILK